MNITKGEWKVTYSQDFSNEFYIDCQKPFDNPTFGEQEANAQLIAEAGNVANATGLSPRQLLEQRNNLIEELSFRYRQEAFGWGARAEDAEKHANEKIQKLLL